MDDRLLFAIVTIIIGLALAGLARAIVRWLEKFAETSKMKWDNIIIAAVGTPVQVGIFAASVYIALKYFGIVPPQYSWIISDRVLNSVYILLGTWITSSIIHNILVVYGHVFADRMGEGWDTRLIEFLERAARYIVWFAGLMLILVNLKIDVTPFLAGAGIAGLAFALAAQDIISNFYGGAVITIDQPFKVGDRIKIDDFCGDVINVGARSTRLQTLDYQIVTIPNNKITSSFVVNYSEPDVKLRIAIPVSVAYGTDIDKVRDILFDIAINAKQKTEYLLDEPAPKVLFLECGESSLKFVLYVWARKFDLSEEVRDTINTEIIRQFAKEGIEIPFPQMDVRLKK
jgi:small-conductance mechanosensitive channel